MQDSPSFCQYCGKPVNPDSRFCPYCGKEIKAITAPSQPPIPPPLVPVPPAAPQNPYPPQKSDNHLTIIAIVVGGIAIILILLILIINGINSHSRNEAEAFPTETDVPTEVEEIEFPTDIPVVLPSDTPDEEDFFPTETPTEDLTQYLWIDPNSVTCKPNSIGYTVVSGNITNNSPYILTNIWLIARVLDQNGNQLSISDGYPDFYSLQPNNTSAFSVSVNGVFDNSTCTILVRSADIDQRN